ncbi:hypothetical protein BU15DRAFT_87714 [Melanogaster broomeanus]|nr:hypothetical protein BU15DRAFT_87714 [Melanogaster broomeanus]
MSDCHRSVSWNTSSHDFRGALKLKQNTTPPHKRRKLTADGDSRDAFGKQYLEEAYTVLNHITTLTRMLANVRRPYLNSWSEIRYLSSSNEERDQIDLQARVILTRCADRIKGMEALEKRRAELAATSFNQLARFLPTRFMHDDSAIRSEYTAAHRCSIAWYVNRRLAEASQKQQELQEERVKRQLERTRTLGSSAVYEAKKIDSKDVQETQESASDSWLGGASSAFVSGIAATIDSSSNRPDTTIQMTDEDEELELTQSQILQFEAENANILRSVYDTLESVQQAEARLVDISNLQMELVTHLTRQTELTDQLYEDAIATTSTAEKSNVQLREARRRAKDSRIFVLVFLIGASLSLLFLHFY